MIKTISILIGKISLFILEKIGRGSSMPGDFTYKINKNILKNFKLPKTTIVVTGSSGKGSTTKKISQVLKDNNYKVTYNNKGSNERSAIITALLKDSDLKGTIKSDICVFELDERYVKYVIPDIKPNYIVITNLTKDQPPRQRHYDFVYEEIYKGLNNATIITNADDPYLQKFNLDNRFKVIYYGINKITNSYKKNKFPVLNIERCPNCNNKLNYNYYHIEYIGNYTCTNPKCNFKRPLPKYEITNYKDQTITINKQYKIYLHNDMLFNYYNTLAAFTTLSEINIDKEKIQDSFNKINKDKKIYNKFKNNNHDVYVLNNKNENAHTFNQSILYTSQNNNKKTLVIGWWQISRRYDFDDLSWLYDIEFELITNIDKVIVAGPQRYDIATRLKYANIDEKKIKIYKDLYEAKDEIKQSKTDIYAILNFDYIKPFNEIMEEE